MKIIISECNKFIVLTAAPMDQEQILSWEQLQEVKDNFFPNKDFFEIYPKKNEIINKANERHLVHKKRLKVPKMHDFEDEKAEIKIVDYKFKPTGKESGGYVYIKATTRQFAAISELTSTIEAMIGTGSDFDLLEKEVELVDRMFERNGFKRLIS